MKHWPLFFCLATLLLGCGDDAANAGTPQELESRLAKAEDDLAGLEQKLENKEVEANATRSVLRNERDDILVAQAKLEGRLKKTEAILGIIVDGLRKSEPVSSTVSSAPIEKQAHELKELITKMSGSAKSRYLSVNLVIEGTAPDFLRIIKENESRLRHGALDTLGSYEYVDSQADGFMERVKAALLSRFDDVLKKHRQGDDALVTKLFFTQFVIQ